MSPASDAGSEKPSARRPLAPLLLLVCVVLVTAWVYSPTLGYPFLEWDDRIYVTDRAPLRQAAAREGAALVTLLDPRPALAGRFIEYFPLRDLTYAVDAWRGGLEARPFRTTNLALHLLNVLLVFGLGRRLGLDARRALLAAALFGLHPLTVEPVAWISGRKDLLAALGVLLSLWLLVAWLRAPRTGRGPLILAGALLAGLGAMASKGPAVILVPLAAWLGIKLADRPGRRRLLLPLGALAALGVLWTVLALVIGRRSGIVVPDSPLFPESIWRAAGAPVHALSRIALPLDLSPSYLLWPARAWLDPYCWAGLLLGPLLWALRRREPVPRSTEWLLAGCFLLALLPTSGIVPVAQIRADRFLYLPLAFVVLLVGAAAARRRWLPPLLFALLPLLALQTYRTLPAWSSDLALWRHVLRIEPAHPFANGALAAEALARGQLEVAKPLLDRALEGAPGNAVTWSNLGRYHRYLAGEGPLRPGDAARAEILSRAERAFRRAAELDRRFASPRAELALIRWWRGDRSEAERLLREALALPRVPVEAALRLGDLLWAQGRRAEAREAVRAFCAERPGLEPCQRWIGAH